MDFQFKSSNKFHNLKNRYGFHKNSFNKNICPFLFVKARSFALCSFFEIFPFRIVCFYLFKSHFLADESQSYLLI